MLIFGIYYAFNSYSNYKFTKGVMYGETATINNLLSIITREGFVTINNDQGNFTLVPAEFAAKQQQ